VTFEQEAAVENSDTTLLSLGHPIVRQAALFLMENEAVAVKLTAVHESLPVGVHPFALYRWTRQGLKQDEELIPVAHERAVAGALLSLLPSALDAPTLELPEQKTWDDLDSVHHQRWLAESTEHAEENRQLVNLRVQSLSASFAARRLHLETQLSAATNEKIKIMKRSELERAQVDFEMRSASLQKAAETGDIRATAYVLGVIEVKRPQ
jgi:hypothetical protein